MIRIFFILLMGVANSVSAQLFTGVWQQTSESFELTEPMEWTLFQAEITTQQSRGLKLDDFEIVVKDGMLKYIGVFRAGNNKQLMSGHMNWASFVSEYMKRTGEGYRLTDVETYQGYTEREYVGLWHSGSGKHELVAPMEWDGFNAEFTRLSNKGERVSDIEIYAENGKRYFLTVWEPGNGKHALLPPLEWKQFEDEWKRLSIDGYRLKDVETYEASGKRYYVGVFHAGTGGYSLWSGGDWEQFKSVWANSAQQGLRLIDLESQTSDCREDCLNHVLHAYDYGINISPLHCEGIPGTCDGSGLTSVKVVYHWPAVTIAGNNYIRTTALDIKDQIFTLPFKKRDDFNPYNGWLYRANEWHEAIDYSAGSPLQSFEVCAAAPGKVIHMGWDDWSGNTVVVSHDAGRRKDVYRTIYMHMRNGPVNDCALSWSKGVPVSGAKKEDYKNYLNNCGCKEKASERNPQEYEWGTNSQKLNKDLLGKTVAAGDVLGWVGSTGPGGFGGNHLHVFFAHRDPTDNRWYLFDPYGIYSYYSCYPQKVDDPITKCARYPVAWKNGKPGYAQ